MQEPASEPETDWSAPSDTKPPFAYNFVIYQAINACNKEKVTLGEVYSQIMRRCVLMSYPLGAC